MQVAQLKLNLTKLRVCHIVLLFEEPSHLQLLTLLIVNGPRTNGQFFFDRGAFVKKLRTNGLFYFYFCAMICQYIDL